MPSEPQIRALPTDFAPAERADTPTVLHQASLLEHSSFIDAMLDSGSGGTLILNSQRQIVVAGHRILKLLDGVSLEDLIGQRPGEAIGCVHARECEGGCGTSASCRECGAAHAILAAVAGMDSERECYILQKTGEIFSALDLLVQAKPFSANGETFVLLTIADISDQKRREVLERTFFHDVLNLAGGIHGLLEVMEEAGSPEHRAAVRLALANSTDLIEEIRTQRDLVAAEKSELSLHPTLVDALQVLTQLLPMYRAHPASSGRLLELDPASTAFELFVDPTLLKRCLGNLIKNAVEAVRGGQLVTVSCFLEDDLAVFEVHNPGYMPESVQRQIFQRSFSTKGRGRGLGTYSVRLLTERYLGGRVSFLSSERTGTRFRLCVPARGCAVASVSKGERLR